MTATLERVALPPGTVMASLNGRQFPTRGQHVIDFSAGATLHDLPYALLGYAELITERLIGDVAKAVNTANLSDLSLVKLPSRVALRVATHPIVIAARRPFRVVQQSVSALLFHIGHIVDVSAEEVVITANAGRIVAGMQDEQIIGNGTVRQFPCHTMRQLGAVQEEKAIAIVVTATKPKPAAICDLNFLPETFGDRAFAIGAAFAGFGKLGVHSDLLAVRCQPSAVDAARGISIAQLYHSGAVNGGAAWL